jgi:hypothetical protein
MRKIAAAVPRTIPTGGNATVAAMNIPIRNPIDTTTDNGNDLNLFHITLLQNVLLVLLRSVVV